MIFLRQCKEFFWDDGIKALLVMTWHNIKNFHICTGEWQEKFETRSGGGMFGFKKCNYDVSWAERTCTICGERKVRGVSQSDYYNWHE